MSVLLDRDTLTVKRPDPDADDAVDEHGWTTGETLVVVGVYSGSFQEAVPRSDNSMTSTVSSPYAPTLTHSATAYLPPDADVQSGDVISKEGRPEMVVATVVKVYDARISGELDCLQCVLAEIREVS